jgi:hypothetical protein
MSSWVRQLASPEGAVKENTDALASEVRKFHQCCDSIVQKLSAFAWNPKDSLFPIILRVAVVRQHEVLAMFLESSKTLPSSVCTLRPACEELIWIRYLRSIDPGIRSRLVNALTQLEILESLEAQDRFAPGSLVQVGFPASYVKNSLARRSQLEIEFKEVSSHLKWPKGQGLKPSTAAIAKRVNSEDLYRFHYFATSRFVHFSVQELGRRGWGNASELTISSSTFAPFWRYFSLRYGAELYLFTLTEVLEELKEWSLLPKNVGDELVKVLSDFNLPIITPDELNL